MEIIGKIISGTHKGSYFVSLEVYQDEFREKLGFEPFPGTLNLEISSEDAETIVDLQDEMGTIHGSGKYGDVKFIAARLNQKINGALLFPAKTQHSHEILEFVAEKNLRKSLKLKDGDELTLEIE
ncbi:CTP-dependent riboflavin kinase [Methanobacterium ferruginis]|jgi:riboflavin kinase|uniref:CTP-dependent riboflavin kinase n=1 Tax=Methanobacterium ferruginis TaxID=710191 RepID=UPI0025735186|nr:CTP-dependent riboflavin kinase [Methanobacterium ferruginis]MCC7551085.1 CTP-dependent riboflavin kinase [Methanobacterium sp.]BDZ67353.1 riboflavin kinase [Methanobacterium ferruginis]